MNRMPRMIPISDLRKDTAAYVAEAKATCEPIFILQRGRATAVLMSFESYGRELERLETLELLLAGERDIAEGRVAPLDDVLDEARKIVFAGE